MFYKNKEDYFKENQEQEGIVVCNHKKVKESLLSVIHCTISDLTHHNTYVMAQKGKDMSPFYEHTLRLKHMAGLIEMFETGINQILKLYGDEE